MPNYELSKNQKKFVKDAQAQGFKVDYSYSGRFMYGRCCPSVCVKSVGEFVTKSKTSYDNMRAWFCGIR